MADSVVRSAWSRIESWCQQNHPNLLKALNRGASKHEIESVEREVQQPLPHDVRESLSIHNGQPTDARYPFLFGQLTLADCGRIVWEYESWKSSDLVNPSTTQTFFPNEAIANRSHDNGWIPIAYEDGCGNCLAVDLAPGPRGIRGQIIEFGADITDQGVLAPSWGEFLLSYAKLLESGLLGKINTQPDSSWREPFDSMFDLNALDALVFWAKEERWPLK